MEGPIDFFRKNYGKKDIERIEREYNRKFRANKFRHYLRSYYRERKDKYPDDAKGLKNLIKLLNEADNRQEPSSTNGDEDRRCSNENCGKESDFEASIKDILDKDRYTPLDRKKYIIREGISYIPDIVCQKGNTIFVIEVKKCTHNHRLFTAIGQLAYHRAFYPKGDASYEYIIALPDDIYECVDEHFVKHVSETFNIHIRPY